MRAGEATDIVVLAAKVMRALEAEGRLAQGDTRDFARSEIGIAVRAGSALPSVADEKAVKQAMWDARKICYSTGPSGDHLKALCEKWGMPPERVLIAPPGVPVTSLVANGEADLGFQQLSELIGQPGVEVAGPLPPEIQAVTVFFSRRIGEGARRRWGPRVRRLSGVCENRGRKTAPRDGAGVNARCVIFLFRPAEQNFRSRSCERDERPFPT